MNENAEGPDSYHSHGKEYEAFVTSTKDPRPKTRSERSQRLHTGFYGCWASRDDRASDCRRIR